MTCNELIQTLLRSGALLFSKVKIEDRNGDIVSIQDCYYTEEDDVPIMVIQSN